MLIMRANGTLIRLRSVALLSCFAPQPLLR
jgi:hypothetical protein